MAAERRIAMVPDETRSMRACLFCSVVQTQKQFEELGCPNCESFMEYKENRAQVLECTSSNYDGLIAMMENDSSWVARWQRINSKSFARGIYAISVKGRLPPEVVSDLQKKGIKYVPRSQS